MDGRDAAQGRQAQVYRLRSGHRRQGRGLIAGIGYLAHPVAEIEFPRLGWNVTGREVQAQIRLNLAGPGFGHHFTMPVLVEPIHHDPIEAGRFHDQLGDRGQRRVQRGLATQFGQAGGHQLQQRLATAGIGNAWLDVDDPAPGFDLGGHPVQGWQTRARHAERGAPQQGGHLGRADQRAEWQAEQAGCCPAQELVTVFAGRLDPRIFPVTQHQHRAMGLDRAGEADRFGFAGGEFAVDHPCLPKPRALQTTLRQALPGNERHDGD